MRAEFGYCVTCDKEIAPKDGNGRRAPNGDYSQVEVQWSNGSRMQIGVCKDCAVSHIWATAHAKAGITQAHWDAWDKAGGSYSKEIIVV